MLKYKINVIQALKEKGYNSTVILKNNLVSQSALSKIRKDTMVGIITINTLCDLLECQPGDIIEFVKD